MTEDLNNILPTDKEVIEERVMKNPDVAAFVTLGRELLAKSYETNFITVEQFKPFIELFNCDKSRLDRNKSTYDIAYARRIEELFSRYKNELSINLYEPTIVIVSEEDRTEVAWLGKVLNRVSPDNNVDQSRRDNLNPNKLRGPTNTKEAVVMEASICDLVEANSTDASVSEFKTGKTLSAIVNGNFFKYNMSDKEKQRILDSAPKKDSGVEDTSEVTNGADEMEFFLDDGD